MNKEKTQIDRASSEVNVNQRVIIFLAIVNKYAEFIQCQQHLHFRGMGDVLEETKPLIEQMKKEKLKWEDLHEYLLCLDADYKYEEDKFFGGIKKYLETDSQKEL